ncbi:hypothetical protein GCM10027612_21020 [Microbispora bryophytorum subsp. camponoti]
MAVSKAKTSTEVKRSRCAEADGHAWDRLRPPGPQHRGGLKTTRPPTASGGAGRERVAGVRQRKRGRRGRQVARIRDVRRREQGA